MEWLFGLVGSLIGAGFGATAANTFALRRERKQEAMKLFLKIHNDIQSYKIALMNWAHHKSEYDEWDLTHVDNPDDRVEARVESDKAYVKMMESFDKLQTLDALLRSDCLGIDLLFDRRGGKLTEAIKSLLVLATREEPYNTEERQVEILNPQVKAIEDAMLPLWKSFDNWTATDWAE